MAEPARGGADDREPAGRPGPGEADARDALITEARACRLAVEDLARHPESPAALEMATLCLSVLEHLGEEARRRVYDESKLEALVAERVAEALAAYGHRGALRALPDPG